MQSSKQTNHKDKLRSLRVLQRLQQIAPYPMGELALLNWLRTDPELTPSIELVRQSLDYLAQQQLVVLVRVDDVDWLAAQITVHGDGWLNNPEDLGLEIYNPGELPEPAPDNYNGRVSSIETLPTEVKIWLDQELVRIGFRNYSELTQALTRQGWSISRSAVGRYGKSLKDRVKQQKERAAVIMSMSEVYENDAPAMMTGAMGTALIEVMEAIQEGEYAAGKDTLSKLVSTLPKLGQGFRNAERHKIEQATRKKALEAAASRVEEAAQVRGLSAEDAKFWIDQVLKGM